MTAAGIDAGRFRSLHAMGLCETEIAQRMGLQPIVARATRRRLGLPPNPGDERDGARDISRLALKLSLLPGSVRGWDHIFEEFREVLNLPPGE